MPNWESMWAGGLKPGQAFDCSRTEPAFQRLLNTATDLPSRAGRTAFVPGCGRGYAVASLFRAGFDATGLDISPTAAEAANQYLTSGGEGTIDASKCRVLPGDFFVHDAQYDLVYDCTFLCALDPSQRAAWAKQCKALLLPEGELVTLIFPVVEPPYEGGPPHCMSVELVRDLLAAEGFAEKELWEVPTAELARSHRGAKEFLARWILK